MELKQDKYTDEFRKQAVRLTYESEKSVAEIAKDLGVGLSTLNQWRRKFRAPISRVTGEALTLQEAQKKLKEQQKEIETLRQEREILKKAATFFAKKTNR